MIGFGGYRIDEQSTEHAEALRHALRAGCNVVETCPLYGAGGSERLIGSVLAEMTAQSRLTRENLVLIDKAGPLQGAILEAATARERDGHPHPEVVKINERFWHCIHPDFLAEQLSGSLQKLRTSYVDFFLLHNPEQQLRASPDKTEFYRRIENAFAYLETEVRGGRIQYYGISSNSLSDPPESPEHIPAEALWEIATRAGARLQTEHHFRALEFPLNILEPGAALHPGRGGRPLLAFASLHDITTLINRPLNAFVDGHVIRLAAAPAHHGKDVQGQLRSCLERTLELESKFPGRRAMPIERVAWGHILHKNASQLTDLVIWRETLENKIVPSLNQALSELASTGPDCNDWIEEYRLQSKRLFDAFTIFFEAKAAEQSRMLSAELNTACPALRSSPTLSQKAMRIIHSLPGVGCVLAGMRRPAYVDDLMAAIPPAAPPLSPQEALETLEAIRQSG